MFRNEIKKTLVLSVPIVVGQLGQMLMSVVDNIMVGKVGTQALAAASIANSLFMLIMVVGFGLTVAVTPLTAIAYGSGKDEECGIVLRQGILLNLFFGILLCGVTYFLSECIQFLNQPPEIVDSASLYMKVLGFSMLPLMLFQSYRQFAEGVSFLKPAMIITLLANIVNILANWIFIYGNLGVAPLGLTGAGIATISSRTFMAMALMFIIIKSSKMKRFDPSLNYRKIDFSMMRRLLAIGIPAGFQYFFEVSAFSASAIMVGWMGTIPLAAHQIALNLASISFMVAMGISSAATIRVSTAVGRGDIHGTRLAGFSATLLCVVFMASAGSIFILFRFFLPTLYVSEKEVIDISATLLVIVAFFQISDGTQAVGLGILRGITDMKIPTLITLAAYWVMGLPSGYFMAFKLDMGIYGVWYGLLVSLTVSGIFMMLRFNSKSRKQVYLH
ncbi:MATE family efflux transporter [Desulfobacula sp.]|jgi:multidrug resistance protein, MATE family|uniref:MATE family efflux transporter n=1 Tax=Desulfobacula sp. TaxID=2593537 RepID=UPI001D9434A4|nr:MATE family efflux transporter [Desulfobacula sp.]MBT4026688.1 MATE family efflux transporter [Desulfobacula sp.]MBT6340208.1 MATE family efflux transporter [Desulfobacula sp.]MBT7259537.1 MATE family efflux transporter [Desulfobacula sp.]